MKKIVSKKANQINMTVSLYAGEGCSIGGTCSTSGVRCGLSGVKCGLGNGCIIGKGC